MEALSLPYRKRAIASLLVRMEPVKRPILTETTLAYAVKGSVRSQSVIQSDYSLYTLLSGVF